ncbi:hypothetical protein [Psychrobacter pacificensis]|nr:hypothetical protein [Psychrobacter pacificensis]
MTDTSALGCLVPLSNWINYTLLLEVSEVTLITFGQFAETDTVTK